MSELNAKARGAVWEEISDEMEMPYAIDRLVEDAGGFSETDHRLLVVVATNETGEASAMKLNLRYHSKRCLEQDLPEVKGVFGQWFSPGDPVVHLANDYERGLYNGSLGHVVSVSFADRTVMCCFDSREILFTRAQTVDLALAYALTCHRLQGSQAERVIVPVTRAVPVNPSWLYTPITRAEVQAICVGMREDLEHIMQRPCSTEAEMAEHEALVTAETVAVAAEAITVRGERPSVNAVRREPGGGSPNAVLGHLRAWKSAQAVTPVEPSTSESERPVEGPVATLDGLPEVGPAVDNLVKAVPVAVGRVQAGGRRLAEDRIVNLVAAPGIAHRSRSAAFGSSNCCGGASRRY
jgi:hypothetical protein